MAIVATKTSFATDDLRGGKLGAYERMGLSFQANTSSYKQYVTAPCNGKIARIEVAGMVTSDATKTYTYVVANKKTNKTQTAASQVFNNTNVLTAATVAALGLTTTTADLACSQGDLIEVDFTGGTGSGACAVTIYFEQF